MNILVCFTAAPDPDQLQDDEWVIDAHLHIDTSFLRPALSSYDQSALEIALSLRDASETLDVPVALGALTIADSSATPLLKTLNALRFNRVVRVEVQNDLRFRPLAVASVLAGYVGGHAPQDVLLLGRQSSLGENAKTHLLTAEILGWPCITEATHVEVVDQSHLSVTSQTDGSLLRQQVRTPCVLSIGDAPNTFLRVPTLKDRVEYGRRPMEVIASHEFRLPSEPEELTGLEVVNHARAGILIQGATPAEKARTLYKTYLKERLPTG